MRRIARDRTIEEEERAIRGTLRIMRRETEPERLKIEHKYLWRGEAIAYASDHEYDLCAAVHPEDDSYVCYLPDEHAAREAAWSTVAGR